MNSTRPRPEPTNITAFITLNMLGKWKPLVKLTVEITETAQRLAVVPAPTLAPWPSTRVS